MRYVLDVNIIISALIKHSTTRRIILESGFDFYFPSIAYSKIIKYKSYIMQKASLNEQEFLFILSKVLAHVTIVPHKEYMNYITNALKVMDKIDSEDSVFVATALALGDSVIWSDDKHLKKQNIVSVISTNDISQFFR